MLILGIESSCDESAMALFSKNEGFLGEWINTQIELHKPFGGVMPGVAAREHLNNFPLLLEEALNKCPQIKNVDQIVVTYGPGLAPCLALGIGFAKTLALAFNIPFSGINHLRGHACSAFIPLFEQHKENFHKHFQKLLPHLGLLVSGGNTILFKIDKEKRFEVLAHTVDDAAGEALDKGAKLLGMEYPGGPLIEKCALDGNAKAYHFPRAFPSPQDMKFSFSGLKTSLRYRLDSMNSESIFIEKANLCASYQQAVIDQLLKKTHQALETDSFASIGLSGGVSNNKSLRNAFCQLADKENLTTCIPHPKHTGDNAAMIAFAYYLFPEFSRNDNWDLSFNPSLTIDGI